MKMWRLSLGLILCCSLSLGVGLLGCGDDDEPIVCTDADEDGFYAASGGCKTGPFDCDDQEASVNPEATEGGDPLARSCGDDIDNDCDDLIDAEDDGCCDDKDGDGYGDPGSRFCDVPNIVAALLGDCDDDATDDPEPPCSTCTCGTDECAPCARCINPGATEIPDNGIDDNCILDETCSAFPVRTDKPTKLIPFFVLYLIPIGYIVLRRRSAGKLRKGQARRS
jgi:hypothetical protein